MDINEAVAQLRAAFPRVKWVLRPTCISAYRDDGGLLLLVAPQDEGWIANCETGWVGAQVPDPVSAVRAWLAAQPTAAFYSEAPGGKTVEARGFVSVNTRRETVVCDSEAGARAYLDDVVAVYPIVIRVPVPVDPPVLVGEVSDV